MMQMPTRGLGKVKEGARVLSGLSGKAPGRGLGWTFETGKLRLAEAREGAAFQNEQIFGVGNVAGASGGSRKLVWVKRTMWKCMQISLEREERPDYELLWNSGQGFGFPNLINSMVDSTSKVSCCEAVFRTEEKESQKQEDHLAGSFWR